MKIVTHQEYKAARKEVDEVMEELAQRMSPYLERRMIELNLLIDQYEAETRQSA